MVSNFHCVWHMCHVGLHIFQKYISAHFPHFICVCILFIFGYVHVHFHLKSCWHSLPFLSSSNHCHIPHLFHIGTHYHYHCDLNMMSNFGCFLIALFFLFMFITIIAFISFCLDHNCVFLTLFFFLVFIAIVVIISFHPNFSHVLSSLFPTNTHYHCPYLI